MRIQVSHNRGMTVITVLYSAEVVQLLATSRDFHVAVFGKHLTRASGVPPGDHYEALSIDYVLVLQQIPARCLINMLSLTHIGLMVGTVILGLSLHEPVLICDTWAMTLQLSNIQLGNNQPNISAWNVSTSPPPESSSPNPFFTQVLRFHVTIPNSSLPLHNSINHVYDTSQHSDSMAK